MARHWQLLLLTAVLVAPTAVFADKKDGEKQRRERWEREYRDDGDRRGRYGRGGWGDTVYDRDYPRNSESEKEWRKKQKERDKDRREAWREAEKDRREAQREWEKDRREAAREARKDGRDDDYRYNRYPVAIHGCRTQSRNRHSSASYWGTCWRRKRCRIGAAIGGTSGFIYDQQTRTKRRRY